MKNVRKTVDFYQVQTEAIPKRNFREILHVVDSIKELNKRHVIFNECPVRLHSLEKHGNYIVGEMCRNKVNEAAILTDEQGGLEPVVKKQGQSMAGLTAFIYHPELNILCLERNRNGVGATTFCRYFMSIVDFDVAIDLAMIFAKDALEKIESMQSYRFIETKIVRRRNGPKAKEYGPLAGAIDIAANFDAPNVLLLLDMGNFKGSLDKKAIQETIKQILEKQADGEEIKSLKVRGDLDEGRETIDLIKNRIKYEDEIELSDDPVEHLHTRVKLLRRAWDAHRKEILNVIE